MSEFQAKRAYHAPDKTWSAFDFGSPGSVSVINHIENSWYNVSREASGINWHPSKAIGAEPTVSTGSYWRQTCERLAVWGPSNRTLKAYFADVLTGVARRPLLAEGIAPTLLGEALVPASPFPKHNDPVGALTTLCEEQHGLNLYCARRTCSEATFQCLSNLATLGFPIVIGGEFASIQHAAHSRALLRTVVRSGRYRVESLEAERAFIKSNAPYLLGELLTLAAKTRPGLVEAA